VFLRVARWFILKPKIPIWEFFEGLGMEILKKISYGHLEYFMAIWYSLWSFGIFFPIWYVWSKKNLATLVFLIANSEKGFQQRLNDEKSRRKKIGAKLEQLLFVTSL
jgi:hypothetical protein